MRSQDVDHAPRPSSPHGWASVRLGDLISVAHGWPFESEYFSNELTGRPIVINIGNFQYTGGFRFESTASKEYRGNYPKSYELEPGETLLVMTCQTAGGEILGIPARVPLDGRSYLHNQRLGRVRVRPGAPVNAYYLYWMFLSKDFNRHLVATATGTKILHTAPSRIEAYRFSLPPVTEQRRIAEILGALDDKIELNRRMNETLEAIIQAIFTSSFGDDTDQSTRVAFSDVIDFQEGPGIMAVDFRSEGVPLIRLAGLIDGVSLLSGCNYLDPEMVARKWSHFTLRVGDVLLSTSASLGRVATVDEEAAGAMAYTGIIRMRPRGDAVAPEVIRMILLSRDFQDQVEAVGAGSVLRHFGPTHLKSMKVTVPEIAKQRSFADVVRPMVGKQAANLRESATLAQLRDTLLPKLLSGEIRVAAAEEAVAQHV